MSEFDTQTILNLTAVLAHNLLAAYLRHPDLPAMDGAASAVYEQQLSRALFPGMVAFVGRLTIDLPPDFDAPPVLARFCADPAAADALNRYGAGEPDGARAAVEALLAAGWPVWRSRWRLSAARPAKAPPVSCPSARAMSQTRWSCLPPRRQPATTTA